MASYFERFLARSIAGGNPGDKEMSFLDHLEELRWQVVKAAAAYLVAVILCSYFADFIVQEILMKPLREVGLKAQVLSPYGIVLLYMEAVMICALIIGMPAILFFVWKFIAPGLLPKERRYISRIVFFTSFCFFAGVAFAYFVLIPTALTFFSTFGVKNIELNVSIDHYISFILTMLLGSGLVFELPMVSYFLTKLGFLTPPFMRHYRRHAIIAILIIAAVVTPTPDMVTQVLMAAPMLLLYEVSIWVCVISLPKEATT